MLVGGEHGGGGRKMNIYEIIISKKYIKYDEEANY